VADAWLQRPPQVEHLPRVRHPHEFATALFAHN
jgi:hypothetical protein